VCVPVCALIRYIGVRYSHAPTLAPGRVSTTTNRRRTSTVDICLTTVQQQDFGLRLIHFHVRDQADITAVQLVQHETHMKPDITHRVLEGPGLITTESETSSTDVEDFKLLSETSESLPSVERDSA
jgi:hypothetical protein